MVSKIQSQKFINQALLQIVVTPSFMLDMKNLFIIKFTIYVALTDFSVNATQRFSQRNSYRRGKASRFKPSNRKSDSNLQSLEWGLLKSMIKNEVKMEIRKEIKKLREAVNPVFYHPQKSPATYSRSGASLPAIHFIHAIYFG